AELRRRGIPRGSGGIESANKLICHVRLKRSGAWWLEANGNAMLRIRCALYNGTVRQIFTDYMVAQGGQATSLWTNRECSRVDDSPARSTSKIGAGLPAIASFDTKRPEPAAMWRRRQPTRCDCNRARTPDQLEIVGRCDSR